MKQTALELICCPYCKSTLSLDIKDENGIIANGILHCLTCDRSYPIKAGIVRFIDPLELVGVNQYFERYYNRLAPFYSIFNKLAFLPFGGERKAREEILEHLGVDGERTLEVSIGNGVNLPYLYELSKIGEIYGIDISIGQLAQCQRLILKRDWQVELFLAMAESLPFKSEMFNNVLHIGGINFFADKKKALEEMIRVVRPGGTVVIADEAERLAKRFNRSFASDHGDEALETMLFNLVPSSMQDIRLEGIWKMHSQPHGYCLVFSKPE